MGFIQRMLLIEDKVPLKFAILFGIVLKWSPLIKIVVKYISETHYEALVSQFHPPGTWSDDQIKKNLFDFPFFFVFIFFVLLLSWTYSR